MAASIDTMRKELGITRDSITLVRIAEDQGITSLSGIRLQEMCNSANVFVLLRIEMASPMVWMLAVAST